ncbi:MAG TPA: type IV-A pilus assembly ATPase PilB [Methylomirabilota bacterium]|nr:type IV-A pilus assembly ATPase PilB [Methylomirabilota bacterium]
MSRRLGDLLVAEQLLSQEQLQQALVEQKNSNEKLGSILVRLGYLNEDQLIGFLSRQYGIPSITLSQLDIDPDVLKLVSAPIARKYEVLPIRRIGNTLTLAMADPTNVFALDDIAFMTNLNVIPVVASQGAIRKAIDRNYDTSSSAITEVIKDLEGESFEVVDEDETQVDVFELKEAVEEAPVVRLVSLILGDAIRRGASDIHLEPFEKVFRIRFRIDGVLQEIMTPPKRLEPAILSRIKIMANLDIAERRLPQDGRIKIRYHNREIDLRVSTLPTIYGEKIVMRLLDKESLALDLGLLGFDSWSLTEFKKAITSPHGMVLVTGPTGSGKTTTLYSAMTTINSPDINIMTAEDPVEYNLKGINQVQIKEEIGRTFAGVLRSFLRQDPDVILVGEVRDLETAQIAIRAALTGHLVLSTLHTNDAPSTIARLCDMGIPSFLISASVLLILAQRLCRKVCPDCKESYLVDPEALTIHGYVSQGKDPVPLYKGKGCQACNYTGMRGRMAIYEVMPVTQEVRDLILHGAPASELKAMTVSQGMKTLRQAGLQKVLEGSTTLEEILRVTFG